MGFNWNPTPITPYDPHYGRSQARNFAQWQARRVVAATDLSDAGIERLAQTVSASA